MARAYNIHIVMRCGVPVAAFTVKHERDGWLKHKGWTEEHDVDLVTVRDGGK